MRCARSLAFLLVVVNIAAAPTTSPTTRPAGVNLSTPETAFWSYVDAVEQGDLGAEEQVVAPLTEDERRAHRESVAMQLAAQRLVVVTRDRLGDDVAGRVEEMLGGIGLGPSNEVAANLRDAKEGNPWNIAGDDAVLGEVSPEIRFRKIDGKWRLLVPVEEKRRELEQQLDNMRKAAGIIDGISRRVNAKELTSTDQIGKALAGLVPVATTESSPQPATAPNKP